MALKGSDDEKLAQLNQKTYKEQAVWFLNSFWTTLQGEAELLWRYVDKCGELDSDKHGEGSGLDEMNAHRFLEFFHETQTVREMRESLRSTGAIGEKERPKAVPLIHWLLFKYQVNWHTMVNASQGDNKEEIEHAQRLLDAVIAAFKDAEQKATAAKKSEAESHARAEESKAREAELIQAKAELEAALAEVKAQEDAYNAKTADLTKKSEEGGVVSRNKAKNELAQHLAEDPLPLRRAKITAEAAVKKAERATNAAAEARVAAEAAAAQATADRLAAEAAVDAAAAKVKEAEDYLDEVKSKPGQAQGAIWWIDRELHEQKKYLPEARGGIRR